MHGTMKKAGLIAICLILLGSGVVMAQGRGYGHGPGHHARMGHGPGPMVGLLQELDLTEDQRDQIRDTIHERMEGQIQELTRESRQARQELERLVYNPEAEESAILDAAHRVGRAGEQMALERHRLAVAIGEILTEEQLQQFQELLAEQPMRAPFMRRRPGGFPSDD